MNKKTKIWFIIASFLILIGCIMFCSVMTIFKWDFTKLETNKLEINEYDIYDNFDDIKIITNTSDIVFIPYDKPNNLIVCNEHKNLEHLVKVVDNTLYIEVVDTREWYEYIGISFNTPKITIYLSKSEYGKLLIKSSTGDIDIPNNFKFANIDVSTSTGDMVNYASVYENIKAKTSTGNIFIEDIMASMIDISTSTGKVGLKNINCSNDIKVSVSTGETNIVNTNCKNLLSNGSTGSIFLENVIATEKFMIERETGDINFKDCDSNDIFVQTDTGDVKGNLLTDKVFFVQTDTGRVEVPKTIASERCEIITDTGDIKIVVD